VKLRISSIVLSFAICVLSQPASAQDFASVYRSLSSLETEFREVARDVGASLPGKINKGSVEYTCLDVPFRAAFELNRTFSHYKFSVAIMSVIKDRAERERRASNF
jgi:hypothetical protein